MAESTNRPFSTDLVDQALVVGGEVDLATVGALREALEDAVGAGPLRVDLCNVTYLDSAGVAALFAYADSGLELVMVQGSIVHRVLDIAGMVEAATVVLVGVDGAGTVNSG